MILDKIQPQAVDFETAVLGSILLHRDAFDTVNEILTGDSFYTDAHQRIFRSMVSLAKKNMPIDSMTVCEELTRSNDIERVGGVYAISKLTNSVVSSTNTEAHSRIIHEKFIQRELIRIASDIITDAYDSSNDVFEMLDSAEKRILEIGTNHVQGGMISIENVLNNAITKIEEWRKNESTLTGIPTGFPELDRATRGWQPGDLIIIAARPSVGKTALALNLIRNAALNTYKPVTVAAWSLEMKAVYLALRMLAAESDIILHKIQTGRLDDSEMSLLINKGVQILSRASIFFDDNTNVNIRSLKAKSRRLKKKNQLGLIVIDYMQLMTGEGGKGNREQEISTISRELKNLAMELDVPVIALSQLSREGVKGVTWDIGPQPSALRESGAIEQDADVIIMLWGPNDQELANDASLDGKRKLRIAKQRNGVLLTIELDFRNEIQLFETIKQTAAPIPNGNWKPVKIDL